MAPLTVGFLMDPLEGVRLDHDSTFALMLEAQARGHRVVYFEQRWLHYAGARVGAAARMRRVVVRQEAGRHFDILEEAVHPLAALDVLFLRKDPPVDVEFLHATQLVELARPRPPVFLNHPRGIRDANEKLFALHFPELMPDTLVTCELAQIAAFVRERPAGTILKPVDGFGGAGVVFVGPEDRNLRSLAELLTHGGRESVIVQAYVPQSRAGDKRIILVDGEPVGAVLRKPPEDDHRGNMAAGGTPLKTGLTERERHICRTLQPALRERGLYLVGIDVLGDFLTEINVTSPTGLVEIDRLDAVSVEARVLDVAERLAAQRST